MDSITVFFFIKQLRNNAGPDLGLQQLFRHSAPKMQGKLGNIIALSVFNMSAIFLVYNSYLLTTFLDPTAQSIVSSTKPFVNDLLHSLVYIIS